MQKSNQWSMVISNKRKHNGKIIDQRKQRLLLNWWKTNLSWSCSKHTP